MYQEAFISGFTEGEGCFSVSFNLRSRFKTGIEVRPSFAISQNKRNLELIKLVQKTFNCGGIRFSQHDQTYKFEVRVINDLVKIIIPFFDKNPLLGIKQKDFLIFKEICKLVNQNLHLNREKLIEIIELSYQMNSSPRRKYTKNELLKQLAS